MGFWDKVKSVTNMVTGNSAKVYLEFVEPKLDEPFKVLIHAQVKDADISINNVYLRMRAVESVQAPDVDLVREADGDVEHYHETVHHSEETYESEMIVSGAEELEANETYTWEAEVQLPPNALPTYLGRNAKHEWMFYAGLDMRGNDPDSDWVECEIYR